MAATSTYEATFAPAPAPNEFDEGAALKFFETIPSLQDMASYAMAIELWRRFISTEDPQRKSYHDEYDFSFLDHDDEAKVKKILDQFQLPSRIRKSVENCFNPVCTEIHDWTFFYEEEILLKWMYITVSDLKYCHWLPNGKIDHRKTASNMMSNPRLTLVDKYQIACAYCLEDEIKQFPVDSLPEDFIERVTTWGSYNLMYYWLLYLKNDLDKILIRLGESVELYLIKSSVTVTWSAVEYFWDRLNVDDQASVLEEIIVRLPHFQKNLFFKMNELQRIDALSKIPVTIMKNFWTQCEEKRFTLQTWIYIRNFVDYDQFKGMWKVLNINTAYLSKMEEELGYLLEIWNHCPDHLKKLAFSPAIVDNILIKDSHEPISLKHLCSHIEFLSAYLSHADLQLRKSIIFERANVFVSVVDLSFTDQLIKLCLPDSDDVSLFKNYVLGLDSIQIHLCQLLSGKGNHFEKINQFLDYFCPDPNLRSELCCKVLENFTEKKPSEYDVGKKWFNVVDFIDQNLTLTLTDRAFEFKKRIVLWFNDSCWDLLSKVGEVTKLTQLFTEVLDVEELAKFKSMALRKFKSHKWFKFDEQFYGGFISWCCNNDEEKVAEFKKTLPVDEIFKKMWWLITTDNTFQDEVDEETIRKELEPLDKFLHWYFDDAQDVRWFKLRKVFGYLDKKPLMCLTDGGESTDVFIKNVLPWFFEGQQSAIDIFKGMYKNHRIGRMI